MDSTVLHIRVYCVEDQDKRLKGQYLHIREYCVEDQDKSFFFECVMVSNGQWSSLRLKTTLYIAPSIAGIQDS